MSFSLAIFPIIFTFGLLAIPRLSAALPPLLGTLSAAMVALWYFQTPTVNLVEAWNDSFWTLISVLAIIGGGVLLAQVMDRTGAQQKLAHWLSAGGPTVASALLMVHGVVPFIETVTGFGVSVMIGLPLLRSFGFTPYVAALLTLLGLMIGPWGSMAPGTLVAADAAGIPLQEMGLASGWMNIVPFIVSGIAATLVATKRSDTNGVSRGQRVGWTLVGVFSGLMLWVFTMLANYGLGTPVAGAAATMITAVIWLLYIRRGRLTPGPGRAIFPYLILLVGTITGQLLYRSIDWGAFGEIIASPALWSTSAAMLALLFLPISSQNLRSLPKASLVLWWSVAIPTALYVLLGVVMAGGGLANIIGATLSNLGPGYLFILPFVAGLSGYITSSGTGANAMFGATQVAAAQQLGVSATWTMAIQNSAAGWAIITGPARVELAYLLARGHSHGDSRGTPVTRGALLKVLAPTVVLSLLIWGLIAVLFLPHTT